MKKSFSKRFYVLLGLLFLFSGFATQALSAKAADTAAAGPGLADKTMSLWQLMVAGGSVMIFLGVLSVLAVASILYHFKYVTVERLTPPDFIENLLSLVERKEHEKAVAVCRQQHNMIAEIVLKGLTKLSKGKTVVEEAIQYEGKARTEKLWLNLSYLGDIAVIAPMLGLLGTVLGMIQAFNYQAFKAGVVRPIPLAQGLAKAMITTAFGLVIAVFVLAFYSYFRGRISTITTTTERVSTEVLHTLTK